MRLYWRARARLHRAWFGSRVHSACRVMMGRPLAFRLGGIGLVDDLHDTLLVNTTVRIGALENRTITRCSFVWHGDMAGFGSYIYKEEA